MSDKFNIEGKLIIESRDHAVEYEPSSMVGLGTVFLRVKTSEHVVPIHISQIDDVVEVLHRLKDAMSTIEGRCNGTGRVKE